MNFDWINCDWNDSAGIAANSLSPAHHGSQWTIVMPKIGVSHSVRPTPIFFRSTVVCRITAVTSRMWNLFVAPLLVVAFLPILAPAQTASSVQTGGNTPPSAPAVSLSPEVVNVFATPYVNLYAVVEDRKGRIVSSLSKEDFRVTENNVPQQIQYFWRETNAPLTLGIVIDTSPSQGSVLAVEQDQAKMLVRRMLRPNDSGFVIHFDQRVELMQNLTGNQQLLARAIDATAIHTPEHIVLPTSNAMEPGAAVGGTHLYDTICFASKLLRNQVGRNVLVLLTDGEDEGSTATLQSALEAAEKSNLIIYSVAITDREFYDDRDLGFHGDSVLKKLALETGGHMSRGKDALSTAAAFTQIGGELRGQYLLRYTPSKKGDGSFRKIKVEVKHGNYRVHARRGYYAEPE